MKPGLLAVLSPCVVGLTFRVIGAYTDQKLLGARAVAGLLIFTTVAGMHALPIHIAVLFFARFSPGHNLTVSSAVHLPYRNAQMRRSCKRTDVTLSGAGCLCTIASRSDPQGKAEGAVQAF